MEFETENYDDFPFAMDTKDFEKKLSDVCRRLGVTNGNLPLHIKFQELTPEDWAMMSGDNISKNISLEEFEKILLPSIEDINSHSSLMRFIKWNTGGYFIEAEGIKEDESTELVFIAIVVTVDDEFLANLLSK